VGGLKAPSLLVILVVAGRASILDLQAGNLPYSFPVPYTAVVIFQAFFFFIPGLALLNADPFLRLGCCGK